MGSPLVGRGGVIDFLDNKNNTLVLPSKSKTKSGSYSYSGAFLNFGNQSYSYSGAFTNFEIPDFDPK